MSFLQIAVISSILCLVGGYIIGVDLGSTFSCVGVMEQGKVEIIPYAWGNRITPSVVSFTDHEILVGDEIYEYGNQFVVNPNNTVHQTKRMIGRKYDEQIQTYFQSFPFQVKNGSNSGPVIAVNYQTQPHEYTPTQIASMILSQIKQTAAAYIGQQPAEAIVTVPVYFNDEQIKATKQAASDAGLHAIRMMNEAVAAAYGYGLDKMQNDALFLVYDLGGNTLDVTLLELDDGVFEILSAASDAYIGGNNFDERLVDHFVETFGRKHNIDISNNVRAKATLRRELEKAKRALSSATSVRIEIEGFVQDIDLSETLTRARFEELNKDLFTKTIKSIEAVLKDADVERSAVDEIVLSGGSTRIPKIKQLVTEFFNGKEPQKGINPDEVVAYGAAVQAALLEAGNYEDTSYTFYGESTYNYARVVLNAESVDININNNYALITYSFEFENIDTNRDGDIQYEMSIDSGAYISHFVGEINGEIYKGITKRKKKAAAEYKQACQEKKNAILVSQDHDANTFKIQTHIQAGSKAVLNVTVEQLLVRTFGYYELSLDISNIDNDFDSKSKVIPVRINLTDSNGIADIEIPFGEYDVLDDTVNKKQINAKVSKQGKNSLSYFIFRYTSKHEVNNQMLFDPKSKTFLHRFGYINSMATDWKILPRRTVFVLDKSGSMWGIWEAAQEALIGAVANMKENDRLGIVLFDSVVYTKRIMQARKGIVDRTIAYLRSHEPGSATNLYGGIEAAMNLIIADGGGHKGDEYVNQIVFVTDGVANVGVTSVDQILENMFAVNGKLAKPISVFGIGIGDDYGNDWVRYLNYPLIRQISIQNGGFDKRIKQSETKQELEKYYKILESPQLTYINVKYTSSNYEINKLSQHKFSTLYSGTDIVICGKLETKDKNINLFDGAFKTAIISEQDVIEKEFALADIIISSNENIDINVERIWAYLSLKHYENVLLQDRHNIDAVMRRLVNENALHLALTFQLVTQWTSMIVVEEKKVDQVDIDGEDDIATLQSESHSQPVHRNSASATSTSGILLLDVTPLSLGIEGADGMMVKIIEKNSVIPTKKIIYLTGNKLPRVNVSVNNGMSGVIMRLFQGQRINVSDNILLGDYILNGKYDKTINVEVTIEIDANGILNFGSNDDINGRNDITITADKSRPSQEDIDEMLRTASVEAPNDLRYAEAVQARNDLESAAYNLKNQLDDEEDAAAHLSEEDKDILYGAANDIIDWLDDNEDADRDDYRGKQQEFDNIVRPIVKEVYPEQGHEDL